MKDFFIAAHESLIEEYLEAHPRASDDEAYERTADQAYNKMLEMFADIADAREE